MIKCSPLDIGRVTTWSAGPRSGQLQKVAAVARGDKPAKHWARPLSCSESFSASTSVGCGQGYHPTHRPPHQATLQPRLCEHNTRDSLGSRGAQPLRILGLQYMAHTVENSVVVP